LQRLMRRAVRSVPVGARLKVRFEDGFQNQAHRPLHHPVSDGPDFQAPDLSPSLRDVHLPAGERTVALVLQLLAQRFEEALDALRLQMFERDPVHSRRTVILLRETVRLLEYIELPHVRVEAPEAMLGFGLRLLTYPRSPFL